MEALGGAASVVGVVSLAIQVCEELRKVQDFWQSVKEASDDVVHISTEMNLFMTWLAIIANNYQRQGFNHRSSNEAAATETLKLCLATVHEMNDGVKDLESQFSRGLLSRRWASVKFVFRKDQREKVMKQMERMKTLLIIVQTCYVGEMQEAGFKSLSLSLRPKDPPLHATSNGQPLDTSTTAPGNENLVNETRPLQPIPNSPIEMVSFDTTASPVAPRRPKHRTMHQENGKAYNFGLAMLRLVTTEQESILIEESGNERRIPARRTRYDLRIAQWLLSCGFSWQSFSIYGSWQYSFRTFRYILEDALIVDFCLEGDVANVQRMFDKGLASPFDRVSYGFEEWSLLHFSIANGHTQLCKFLIECGLGRGSASGMSRQPILSLIGSVDWDWTMSNPTAHLDTLRIMMNEGQYDPMEKANYTSVMHSFNGSSTVYQWLLAQEEFLIDFEQTSVNVETIAAALIYSEQPDASKCLEAVFALGIDLNDPAGSPFLGDGLTLAHRAVRYLKYRADNLDFPKRIKVLWDAGADFHTPRPHSDFGTTLDFVFGATLLDAYLTRSEYRKYGVERQSVPKPPLMPTEDVIEYDRLEDTSAIKHRSRTPKSLWYTWCPGSEFSILEVAQRYLDAWMEVLLEAGLDIVEYGRREDQLHPEGLLHDWRGEARVYFEYGDYVNGCRIHVTEIWSYDLDKQEATPAEPLAMPCSWDFDDE